jgi:tetratricopeptide (TPR) repeat protein
LALADARAWEEAIAVARVTRAQHPDDLGANLNLALLYRRATPPLPAEAVRYYTAALSLRPDSVEVRHQLGITLSEELGRHEEAAEAFRDALSRSPGDEHILLHLGEALFALGDVPGAVEAFRDCVANEPPGGTSAHHIAWQLANAEEPARRDLESALEFAEHATSVYSYDASAWDTLAVIRYWAGDWAECIAALERSMDLTRGGNAYPWFYVSASHARLGELEEARIWFDRAVEWMDENSPDSEELTDLRAEASALLDGDNRE